MLSGRALLVHLLLSLIIFPKIDWKFDMSYCIGSQRLTYFFPKIRPGLWIPIVQFDPNQTSVLLGDRGAFWQIRASKSKQGREGEKAILFYLRLVRPAGFQSDRELGPSVCLPSGENSRSFSRGKKYSGVSGDRFCECWPPQPAKCIGGTAWWPPLAGRLGPARTGSPVRSGSRWRHWGRCRPFSVSW